MRTIHIPSLYLFCLIVSTACASDNGDNSMIWDFAPIELHISVQDAQGHDLLNPETPGNIAKQGIKAIYKDKIYKKDVPVNQTKAYKSRFNGLQTQKTEEGKYFLTFGEFEGNETFKDEKIIIDWNDGTQDVITFSSKLTWKSQNEPVFSRKFYLNGEDNGLNLGNFIIIKEPSPITSIISSKFIITDTHYGIDADNKEKISDDLSNNPLYPIGSAFTIEFVDKILSIGSTGKYTLLATDNTSLINGTIEITNTAGFSNFTDEMTAHYKLIPPDNQIYGYIQWKVDSGSNKRTYNIFIVRSSYSKSNIASPQNLWIYEDLTDYYQAKFPDNEIKEVVRLQISKYSPTPK